MKTTKEFLEIYKNWKTKREKEIAEKIANQDPLIRKETNCKKVSWRDRSDMTNSGFYLKDWNYKGYYDQRIF